MALVSLGCPKNLVDSERMLAMLAEDGCVVGAPPEHADVVVVNTCGFVEAARRESIEAISRALACKRSGRVRRVVAAGCLATREGTRLTEALPGLDAIVGVDNRHDILRAAATEGFVACLDCGPAAAAPDAGRFRLTPRHTAYLRIAEGCSHRCTFCTIPAIRGPFRSKRQQAVLAEARELAADGAVELNIIAQDTTAYGLDLAGKGMRGRDGRATHGRDVHATLPRLLERLAGVKGVRWLRLMYTHPLRFSDELIDAIAGLDKVVKYVDLPLQHINDRVLRLMGRRLTRAATERLLWRLRERVPGIAIRTTFIAGFPGEGRREFRELLDFVLAFKFDAMGVFEYSPEEGTPAARLGRAQGAPRCARSVKSARTRELMLAQRGIAMAAAKDRVGRRLEVLVDGPGPRGRLVGRWYAQAPQVDSVCLIEPGADPTPRSGRFIQAVVTGAGEYDLVVRPALNLHNSPHRA